MNTYLLFKSVHLIAVISWMAGLLYLPRIFVYHSENLKDLNTSNIFKTMERKLYNYIMMPAMILSWIFGLLLISKLGFDIFENSKIGYSYSHISNNDWGDSNPGTDNQQITFSKNY